MNIIGNRQESKQISTNYSVERIALIDRQPILWWRWFADQLKTLHSLYKTKPTTSTGPPSHLWGLLGADKTQWRGSFQLIAANIGTNCDTVSDTHTHRGRLATISIPRTRNKGQLISDFFHIPCVLVCWGFSTSKEWVPGSTWVGPGQDLCDPAELKQAKILSLCGIFSY